MTTKITEECINCGACEPECPNVAIYAGAIDYEWQGAKHAPLSADFYYIVPEKCTECVGFFDREACAAVCPVDCCIPDPDRPESEEVLLARARVLHPDKEFAGQVPSRFSKADRSSAAPAAVESRAGTATAGPTPPAATSSATPVAAAEVPTAPPSAAAAPAPAKPAAGASPAPAVAEQKAAAAAPVASAPGEARAVGAPAAKAATTAPAAAAKPQPKPAAPQAQAGQDSRPEEAPRRAPESANFDELKASVVGARGRAPLRVRLARRLRGAAVESGVPGFDGFTSAAFESKRERERRYGEVYRIEQHAGGYCVRFEMPRVVPQSAARQRLGIGEVMPDYDLEVGLQGQDLVVCGHVVGKELRALCGVSSAFPADFRTAIRLEGRLADVGYRCRDKVLEVIIARRDGRGEAAERMRA